jgi:NAD(P)-dependent dehydrogenase (short-subunit alcohol dehydrogenase family)
MEQRTALVTGSARGIGLAIGERLTSVGYRVIGVDVADGSPPGTIRCDLSSWQACVALVQSIPPVDVLVNNAAILIEKGPEEITEDDFAAMVAVNLRAPFLLTRECGRAMQDRGAGRVINISSVSARTGGFAATGTYAATKAGLIALTKYFARLYAASGITVNAVAPGAIDAPMAHSQRLLKPNLDEEVRALVPTGRWGRPEEVARLVEFLASDEAAFVTGTTIDINGGWVMV